LLSCFESPTAKYLDDTPVAFATFLQIIRTYFRPGSLSCYLFISTFA
jgi:hypothetical protein